MSYIYVDFDENRHIAQRIRDVGAELAAIACPAIRRELDALCSDLEQIALDIICATTAAQVEESVHFQNVGLSDDELRRRLSEHDGTNE